MPTVKLFAKPSRKVHRKLGRGTALVGPKAVKASIRKTGGSIKLNAAQKTLYTGIGQSGLFTLSNTQNSYEGVVSYTKDRTTRDRDESLP
jgi:hypothetical protein